MNQRTRQFLIGCGVMTATQLAALLAIHYLMPQTGPEQFSVFMAAISTTLAAFLAGGFVMGRLAERPLVLEPMLAVFAVLLLDILSMQVGAFKGLFVVGAALQVGDLSTALPTGIIGVVAAIVGAYGGQRLSTPVEGWMSQALAVSGLMVILFGPYLLVSAHLPMALSLIIGLAFLGSIGMGAYRFEKTRRDTEELSIRPQSHLAGAH